MLIEWGCEVQTVVWQKKQIKEEIEGKEQRRGQIVDIIRDIAQGSDQWHQLRIGSLGGSRISQAVALGAGKGRKSLMYDMVGEMLEKKIKDGYRSKHMIAGIEYEPEERDF